MYLKTKRAYAKTYEPKFVSYANFDFTMPFESVLSKARRELEPDLFITAADLSIADGTDIVISPKEPDDLKWNEKFFREMALEQKDFCSILNQVIDLDTNSEQEREAIHTRVKANVADLTITLVLTRLPPVKYAAHIHVGRDIFWQELHLWLLLKDWSSLSRCLRCGRFLISKTKKRRFLCGQACRQASSRATRCIPPAECHSEKWICLE